MDTMFSSFQLTASRLATLLSTVPEEHALTLQRWHLDDQRSFQRRNYYRRAHDAIVRLHRGASCPADLRELATEWGRGATTRARSREMLLHNSRALDQYLDEHQERSLALQKRRRLEAYVAGIRVTAFPHLRGHAGPVPTLIWLDCSEVLREEYLIAKCCATLWIAQLMGLPQLQVEAIHAASHRIVARDRLPRAFAGAATATCQFVHRAWSEIERRPAQH